MDFNQLYSDHRILLVKAERAHSACLREGHRIAASQVAGRISCMQRALGAAGSHAWDTLAIVPSGSLAGPARHLRGYAA